MTFFIKSDKKSDFFGKKLLNFESPIRKINQTIVSTIVLTKKNSQNHGKWIPNLTFKCFFLDHDGFNKFLTNPSNRFRLFQLFLTKPGELWNF